MSSEIEARLFAGEQRAWKALAWFRRFPSHSWMDAEEFIGMAVRSPQSQEDGFEWIERARLAGITTPSASPGFKRFLWKAFRASLETDALTAMAGTIVPGETKPFSWKVFETDPLTANLVEGEFVRISGAPGKGKTSLGCVLIERWIAKGNRAFSNIRLDIENHVYVTRTSELLRAIVQARREDVKWFFQLDEPRIAGYIRAKRITNRSQNLDKVVSMSRKLGGNMGLIEQNPEDVPALIVAWARNMFFCHEPGVVSIDLRGPELEWRQDVRDFPRTKLPFETRDIAAFATDVDTDAMFQEVAGSKDQLQAILDYLDRPKKLRQTTRIPIRNEHGQIIRWDDVQNSTTTTT